MNLDNLQTFHSLFSNWRFHVPDYQRGYAWGEKQWKELMDDLTTLTEDNEHFTGLLVLHENKDPGLRLKTRGIDFSLNFWAFPQYAGVAEARLRIARIKGIIP